jgi:hypothetical protein
MRWKDSHCGHYQHGLTYYWSQCHKKYNVYEENLHPQCVGCNKYRGGMLDKYTIYLLDMYGEAMARELHLEKSRQKAKPLKMRIDDYWEIEKEYKAMTEELSNA